MSRKPLFIIVNTLLIILLSYSEGSAALKLPALFGDNMVLQRDMRVPIYGWADAGQKIQVEFMDKTYPATTGSDGKWHVKLGKYPAGGPYQMKITGNGATLNFSNILIGDVWFASGQSNMEFGIQTEKHGKAAITGATDSQIHFFYVPMNLALQPLEDIASVPANSINGKWLVCSPEIMANLNWAWHGFSAIGLYFARQIRKSTGIPIGMIGSYRGGTPVQAWMSIDELTASPAFTKYVDAHQKLVDNYASASATFTQRQTTYRDSLKNWNAEVGNAFTEIIKKWNTDVQQATASGQTPPPRPKPSRPAPRAPEDPLGNLSAPTNCYNGVIAPVVGYGIKGVIWYQGETNGDRLEDAVEYKDLFPRLIRNWRNLWQQGDFPFLFVQLPNYHQPVNNPSQGFWPWVREGQQSALALKHTGMAVITDAGETTDVHPSNKLIPANRLVLVTRRAVYGDEVVASGPVYQSMKIEGNQIIIKLKEINQGLTAGALVGDSVLFNDSRELKGFGIAGPDRKFVTAKAVIAGDKLIISNPDVTGPLAVRYNWTDNPPGNLYNKNGLPARPFRTDDWSPLK